MWFHAEACYWSNSRSISAFGIEAIAEPRRRQKQKWRHNLQIQENFDRIVCPISGAWRSNAHFIIPKIWGLDGWPGVSDLWVSRPPTPENQSCSQTMSPSNLLLAPKIAQALSSPYHRCLHPAQNLKYGLQFWCALLLIWNPKIWICFSLPICSTLFGCNSA